MLFGILSGNPQNFLKAFVIGLILGAVYMISKSIWIPILIHTIVNVSVPLLQEVENLSVFLNPSKIDTTELNGTTEVLDTFVYNSLKGGNPRKDLSNMPLVLNIILGLVLILVISMLLVWLLKSNKRVEK